MKKQPNHQQILDAQSVMRGMYKKLVNRGVYDFTSKRSKQVLKRFLLSKQEEMT